MSHHFIHKLHSSQHGFSQAKSTTTKLIPSLDFISPPFSSQRRVDSIYLNVLSTSDFVSHTVSLTKLLLSDGYLNWFGVTF